MTIEVGQVWKDKRLDTQGRERFVRVVRLVPLNLYITRVAGPVGDARFQPGPGRNTDRRIRTDGFQECYTLVTHASGEAVK